MGKLTITKINRVPGAFMHKYRIDYRQVTDPDWTVGPTLTWQQAGPAPGGLLPLVINTPSTWYAEVIFKIVTICSKGNMRESVEFQPVQCFKIKDVDLNI